MKTQDIVGLSNENLFVYYMSKDTTMNSQMLKEISTWRSSNFFFFKLKHFFKKGNICRHVLNFKCTCDFAMNSITQKKNQYWQYNSEN